MRGRELSAIAAIAFLTWVGSAGAQLSSPVLKPLPPKKTTSAVAAVAAALPANAGAATASAASSPWQMLPNQPPVLDYIDCGPGNPILLTDGTVMVADDGCQDWWKLTPDAFGSYLNGTWTQLASTPSGYSPLYHATAVLPDGRVIIEGGEYNQLKAVWSNQGAIYDPREDEWTLVDAPAGWTTIGDATGVVLPDGTFMLGNCCTVQAALLDPRELTWTPTGTGKFDTNNEEGWTLLPSGNVLTVDA
ncbi:MAG TPA: kelch repeat-containing protein, partial [Steroidobacteraceae bacterium]